MGRNLRCVLGSGTLSERPRAILRARMHAHTCSMRPRYPVFVRSRQVDMCKAAFVQMHRMFKVRVDKEAASPKGFPLHIIPDSVEVLLAPRMYYELKRGTRKPVL